MSFRKASLQSSANLVVSGWDDTNRGIEDRTAMNPDFLSARSSHHWALTGPGHGVQFYRDDAERVRLLTDFVTDGLNARQPVVAIVESPRLLQIREALTDRGSAVKTLEDEGQLILLNARLMLTALMNGHGVDPSRFRGIIGAVMERAGGRRRVVRAYGEMVDLLWKDGQAPAALRLERLWNALARDYHFALLCGYSADNFISAEPGNGFEAVCGQHRVVVPIEPNPRPAA